MLMMQNCSMRKCIPSFLHSFSSLSLSLSLTLSPSFPSLLIIPLFHLDISPFQHPPESLRLTSSHFLHTTLSFHLPLILLQFLPHSHHLMSLFLSFFPSAPSLPPSSYPLLFFLILTLSFLHLQEQEIPLLFFFTLRHLMQTDSSFRAR